MEIWDALRILMSLHVHAKVEVYDETYAVLRNYEQGEEYEVQVENNGIVEKLPPWKDIVIDEHVIKIDDTVIEYSNANAYVDEGDDYAILTIEFGDARVLIPFRY